MKNRENPISASFFADPEITALSKEAKLIAVYLVLYSHSKKSRSFYMPSEHLELLLGLNVASTPEDLGEVEDALNELSTRKLVEYDGDNCLTVTSNWFSDSDGE
ncbi:hypothetical protein GZ77_21145 [Endozoicomonas montiporae]|uniref:Replication protein n=2 Tax=Endozoicomonas montiporae TaxID=1027273 RepID=A0A081N3B7_9GAMM|nr:hypothetical protein [Endozoicomonas montiporae]AMO58237.1 hypothetical protein EZMO1_4320 [Endozoicomonas montiporae CL-33]KEQ12940.1 hypothetical protein GZ77_21145 [Endozoicomonas montiporae]